MPNSEYLPLIKRYYPDAITSTQAILNSINRIKSDYGFSPSDILLADSICCDDINSIEYPKPAYDMIGPFRMGGLGGYPFGGLTAMGAISHHVPDHGAVLIFFAPHIGVSLDEPLGCIHRIGQKKTTHCCGALYKALENVSQSNNSSNDEDQLDYQQHVLEQLLFQKKQKILSATLPIYEATQVVFEDIYARIRILVEKTLFNCQYVFMLGGVLINGDPEMGSFCSIQQFECLDTKNKQIQDLRSYQ